MLVNVLFLDYDYLLLYEFPNELTVVYSAVITWLRSLFISVNYSYLFLNFTKSFYNLANCLSCFFSMCFIRLSISLISMSFSLISQSLFLSCFLYLSISSSLIVSKSSSLLFSLLTSFNSSSYFVWILLISFS